MKYIDKEGNGATLLIRKEGKVVLRLRGGKWITLRDSEFKKDWEEKKSDKLFNIELTPDLRLEEDDVEEILDFMNYDVSQFNPNIKDKKYIKPPIRAVFEMKGDEYPELDGIYEILCNENIACVLRTEYITVGKDVKIAFNTSKNHRKLYVRISLELAEKYSGNDTIVFKHSNKKWIKDRKLYYAILVFDMAHLKTVLKTILKEKNLNGKN